MTFCCYTVVIEIGKQEGVLAYLRVQADLKLQYKRGLLYEKVLPGDFSIVWAER